MNIDKENFKQEYPKLKQLIQSATFIAFDMEFTGINIYEYTHVNYYDSLADIYQKQRHVVMNNVPLQLGICFFVWNQQEKKYIASPYNFYLFNDDRRVFSVESRCCSFMAGTGLDFNRILAKGVRYKRYNNLQTEKNLQDLESILSQRTKFYLNPQTELNKIKFYKKLEEFIFSGKGKKLRIDCYSDFLAYNLVKNSKAVWDHLGYSCKISWQVNQKNKRELLVRRIKKFEMPAQNLRKYKENNEAQEQTNNIEQDINQMNIEKDENQENQEVENLQAELQNVFNDNQVEEEKKEDPSQQPQENKNEEEDFDTLYEKFGMSFLIRDILKSQVPICGHNCVFDIGYLYEHFIEPMPETYLEFIHNMHKVGFNNFYDTKILMSLIQRKYYKGVRTGMKQVQNYVTMPYGNQNFMTLNNSKLASEEISQKYKSGKNLHDAAFDAYITGMALITFNKFMEFSLEKKANKKIKIEQFSENRINWKLLEDQKNNIHNQIHFKSDLNNFFYAEAEVQKFKDTVLYCESKSRISSIDDLAKIFTKFGDLQIIILDYHRFYVQYRNFGLVNSESENQEKFSVEKIVEIMSGDENLNVKGHKDRKKFKAFYLTQMNYS